MARLLVLVTLLVALVPSAADAAGPAATKRALARELARTSQYSGAYVVDLGSGEEIFAAKADVERMPASVEKLYTAAGALLRHGPDGRLTTTVLSNGLPDESGTLTGNIVLHGGGDPTFGTVAVQELAGRLAQAGLKRVTGRVIGDESAFDAFRGVPSSGFRLTSEVGPLSALSFNHGRTGRWRPYFQASPARFAAQAFERALEHEGVDDRRLRARRGRTHRHDAAVGLAVAAGLGDRAPDEPAVGQLDRRDAQQGPRVAVRRRGLDGGGRRGRARGGP